MATVEHCLYCFEALSASLEKRTSMTLYEVQASWADYHKGLERDEDSADEDPFDDDDDDDGEPEPPSTTTTSSTTKLQRPKIRNPTLQRLAARTPNSGSSSSTPASSSSSSLGPPSTAASTPASSTNSFTPIGVAARRTSQRTSTTISSSPLFVTWNVVSARSSSRSLRGCIGTFEAQPLSTGLSSYALTSALSDHRFSPISLAELPSLEVSVTLLTDFEGAADAMDWELGVHGIRISFSARGKRYGACYLPDVAVEQGWDKEETVVSLMRKAGWGGRRERWGEVEDLKVVRFQGLVESVGYDEFKRWREWIGKAKKK